MRTGFGYGSAEGLILRPEPEVVGSVGTSRLLRQPTDAIDCPPDLTGETRSSHGPDSAGQSAQQDVGDLLLVGVGQRLAVGVGEVEGIDHVRAERGDPG